MIENTQNSIHVPSLSLSHTPHAMQQNPICPCVSSSPASIWRYIFRASTQRVSVVGLFAVEHVASDTCLYLGGDGAHTTASAYNPCRENVEPFVSMSFSRFSSSHPFNWILLVSKYLGIYLNCLFSVFAVLFFCGIQFRSRFVDFGFVETMHAENGIVDLLLVRDKMHNVCNWKIRWKTALQRTGALAVVACQCECKYLKN